MRIVFVDYGDIQKYLSFISSNLLDFESIYLESSSTKSIVLTYIEEPELVRRSFVNFAKSKVGSNYLIVDINFLGNSEEKQVKRLITKPMEEVSSEYKID